jgi:predicted ester cyclase
MEFVDELFASDYKHHDPANPDGAIGGVADVRFHLEALRRAFPDVTFTVEDMVESGDDILVRWSARLTHTGDYFGIPPTGKAATITGMNHWRMGSGKAVEGWVNRDDLGLLQQLGVVPSPS